MKLITLMMLIVGCYGKPCFNITDPREQATTLAASPALSCGHLGTLCDDSSGSCSIIGIGSAGVMFENAATEQIFLPQLRFLAGPLILYQLNSLTSFEVPKLEAITGYLNFLVVPKLEVIAFPSLRLHNGTINAQQCDAATKMSFPKLVSVSERLSLLSQNAMVQLSLPQLSYVGTVLSLTSCNSLASLELPSLVSVGFLQVSQMPALSSLSLPSLLSANFIVVGGNVGGNSALSELALPVLSAVKNLRINSNPLLLNVELPSLESVSGDITLAWNGLRAKPSMYNLPLLAEIGGDFVVGLGVGSSSTFYSKPLSSLETIGGSLQI